MAGDDEIGQGRPKRGVVPEALVRLTRSQADATVLGLLLAGNVRAEILCEVERERAREAGVVGARWGGWFAAAPDQPELGPPLYCGDIPKFKAALKRLAEQDWVEVREDLLSGPVGDWQVRLDLGRIWRDLGKLGLSLPSAFSLAGPYPPGEAADVSSDDEIERHEPEHHGPPEELIRVVGDKEDAWTLNLLLKVDSLELLEPIAREQACEPDAAAAASAGWFLVVPRGVKIGPLVPPSEYIAEFKASLLRLEAAGWIETEPGSPSKSVTEWRVRICLKPLARALLALGLSIPEMVELTHPVLRTLRVEESIRNLLRDAGIE